MSVDNVILSLVFNMAGVKFCRQYHSTSLFEYLMLKHVNLAIQADFTRRSSDDCIGTM